MKIDYDQASDILSMLFSSSPVEESDEVKPGVILDYDDVGNVVGIEIPDASRRMENPTAVGLSVNTLITELCRLATMTAMYSAARTRARPPQIVRRPRKTNHCRDCKDRPPPKH